MKITGVVPMFRAAKTASVLELFFYDAIGQDWYGDGITASSVQKAIKDATDFKSITVHVNSPGGDSFEGITIHNILRQQEVPVNVIVEGLAASAAFTISMAGDTIQVAEAGMMMLHNALAICYGYADDMRKLADLLDKHSGTLRDMYAKRSGQTSEDVQTLMTAETWLTAEEAIAQGFATEKLATTPDKAKEAKALAAQFDLGRFNMKLPEAWQAEQESEVQALAAVNAAKASRDIELRRRQLGFAGA